MRTFLCDLAGNIVANCVDDEQVICNRCKIIFNGLTVFLHIALLIRLIRVDELIK